MKAIILARVSTAEQKEAGNSLPSQLFRLEKYAQERGFEVIYRHEYDESAYKVRRDEFAKVLKVVKSQKETVIICCDKVDRLVRNFTSDLVFLEAWRCEGRIELHFPSDNLVLHKDSPATDLFRFTIGVSLAKYYSDSIRDNVKRAFEQKLRRGEWIGPPRLGYVLDISSDGRKNHVPDPNKAHLITQMFESYASGHCPYKMIKKEMEAVGLVGKGGKPLSVSMVAHVLQDPFYCGRMVSKGVEYPHRYESLVSAHLFRKCNEVRESWQKKPAKHSGRPYIFRKLLRCARCGCAMTPEIKKEKYIFYSCTNARGVCRREYVPERTLLEPIYEILKSIQLSKANVNKVIEGCRAANSAKSEFHRKEISRLRTEYNILQTRLEGLPALLLDGAITREVYEGKLKEWKNKQYDLNLQMEDYTRADETYLVTMDRVLNLARRAPRIFESSEIPEKRLLLKYLLQNPRVEGKKLLFELRAPFDTIALVRNGSMRLPASVRFRTLNWEEIRRELEEISPLLAEKLSVAA